MSYSLCYDGYNQRGYEEVCMTMRSAMTGNDADPKVAYGINPQGGGMNPCDKELGQTQAVCHQEGVMQVQSEAIGFKAGQSANGGLGDEREVSPTLSHTPSALEPTVAQDNGVKCFNPQDQQTGRVYDPSGAMASLQAGGGASGMRRESVLIAAILSQMRYIVRRLTPTECERLMGLPDNYTIPSALREGFADGAPSPSLVAEFQRIFDTFGAIMHEYALAAYNRNHREGEPPPKPPKPKSAAQVAAWLKKISDPATCPDSPRYKACGNGMCTNQVRWIFTRLLSKEGVEW